VRWIVSVLLIAMTVCMSGCDDGATSRPRQPDLISETRAEVERALRQPVPAGHVKVTVTRYELDDRSDARRALFVRYQNPRLQAEAGALGAHGIEIYGVRDGLAAALSASRETSVREEAAQQFLLLLPGHPARFDVLQIRHEAWPVVIPVWRGYEIAYTIREQVTGSGLRVQVVRAGADQVEIELLPYFHRAERRDLLEVQELATRLAVAPGATYVIASNRTSNRNFGSSLFTRRERDHSRESVILLRADVGQ